MKKIFIILFTILICATTIKFALAAPQINELTNSVGTKAGYNTNVDEYEVSRIIGRVIQGAMALVGMIFLTLTVYAGFLWMTAGGNEESVNKAQGILKRATIGLVIVIAAYGITVFVSMMLSSAEDRSFWDVFYNSGRSTSLGDYL